MAQNATSLVKKDLQQLVQQEGDVLKMEPGLEQTLSVQVQDLATLGIMKIQNNHSYHSRILPTYSIGDLDNRTIQGLPKFSMISSTLQHFL